MKIDLDSDVMWWLKMCLITGVTIPIVLIISFVVLALSIHFLRAIGIDIHSLSDLIR